MKSSEKFWGKGSARLTSMSVMLSKTYDDLRSAGGVSDKQARTAAAETAVFDPRLLRVEIKLNLLITLGASTRVGVGLVLLRLFVFDWPCGAHGRSRCRTR